MLEIYLRIFFWGGKKGKDLMLIKAIENICIGIGTASTEKLNLALYNYQGFKFFMMALLKDMSLQTRDCPSYFV